MKIPAAFKARLTNKKGEASLKRIPIRFDIKKEHGCSVGSPSLCLNLYFCDLHDQLMTVTLRRCGDRDAITLLREQQILSVVDPLDRFHPFGEREGVIEIGNVRYNRG